MIKNKLINNNMNKNINFNINMNNKISNMNNTNPINFLNNNNIMNNINMFDANISNFNNNNQNESKIILYFIFEAKKNKIFIDVNENEIFQNIIKKLEEKYEWLKSIQNRIYIYNGGVINYSLSIKDLKIVDNSEITIK